MLKYFSQPWFIGLFIVFAISAYLRLPACTVIVLLILIANILILLKKGTAGEKKLKELEKLNKSYAVAIREGKIYRVPSDELVVGDIVLFDKDTVISADLRIIECEELKVRETVVTGENQITEKYATKIEDREISLSEMKNILFKASTIVSGNGAGIVITTGGNTEIGKIIQILLDEKKNKYSIEKSIQEIFNKYSLLGFLFSAFLFGIQFYMNHKISNSLYSMLIGMIAVAPIGIFFIVDIISRLVSRRMKKEKIMFKDLSMTQLLSGVNIICTDKIGAFPKM